MPIVVLTAFFIILEEDLSVLDSQRPEVKQSTEPFRLDAPLRRSACTRLHKLFFNMTRYIEFLDNYCSTWFYCNKSLYWIAFRYHIHFNIGMKLLHLSPLSQVSQSLL